MNFRIAQTLGLILALVFSSLALADPGVRENKVQSMDASYDASLSGDAATSDAATPASVAAASPSPAPTPARVGSVSDSDLSGLSLQEQILKLEAATQDQAADLDRMRQALDDMKNPADTTGISNYNLPTVWKRLHFHGNLDV